MIAGPGKIIVTVGRLVGEALLAGVGLEIAKVTGEHLKKRLGPKDAKDPKKDDRPKEDIAAENEKLKTEIEKLREELAKARGEAELGRS